MRCPNCQADNPDQSAVCAECGARLRPAASPPDQEPTDGPRAAQQALEQAFRLSDQDRVAEAIGACRRAIALNPASSAAYSLLGILCERAGQREQAVHAYEQALQLSPEGPLDRETLRQLITRPQGEAPPARAEEPPAPARRRGLAPIWYGVIAAAVVLIVLVVAAARAWRQVSAPEPRAARQPRATAPAPSPPVRVEVPPPPRPVAPAPMRPPAFPERAPMIPPSPRIRPPAAPSRPPTPAVTPPPAVAPARPAPPTPQARATPPQAAPEPPGATAPPVSLETARQRYFEGDLEEAISAYESVTAADAEPGAWQELGLLYHQAGRAADAAAAYRRALDLYRAQVEADPDAEAAHHAIRVLEAALGALDRE